LALAVQANSPLVVASITKQQTADGKRNKQSKQQPYKKMKTSTQPMKQLNKQSIKQTTNNRIKI